jgi:anti-sigma regulatory factor (Ser/Thr protein kinase)
VDNGVVSKWFEPVPSSVLDARRLMRGLPPEVPPNTKEDVRVVVSELASNAVVHAHTRFLVCVRLEPTVRVEVTDSSAAMPMLRRPDRTHAGGRGLVIVNAFAQHWGADTVDGGKIVWADLGPLP